MNELLENIVSVILIPLLPSLAILLGLYVRSITRKLEEELKLDKDSRTALRMQEATNAVIDAVQYTTQTYVDFMKKHNAFDNEAQKEAMRLSREKAMLLLDASSKDLIQNISGDLDSWLTTMIESKLLETKPLNLHAGSPLLEEEFIPLDEN